MYLYNLLTSIAQVCFWSDNVVTIIIVNLLLTCQSLKTLASVR